MIGQKSSPPLQRLPEAPGAPHVGCSIKMMKEPSALHTKPISFRLTILSSHSTSSFGLYVAEALNIQGNTKQSYLHTVKMSPKTLSFNLIASLALLISLFGAYTMYAVDQTTPTSSLSTTPLNGTHDDMLNGTLKDALNGTSSSQETSEPITLHSWTTHAIFCSLLVVELYVCAILTYPLIQSLRNKRKLRLYWAQLEQVTDPKQAWPPERILEEV